MLICFSLSLKTYLQKGAPMPNIELRGFEPAQAGAIKAQIKKEFSGKSYEPDYVISVVPCSVTDCNDIDQAFIRLVTTEHDHNGEIIQILTGLGYDVEHAPLIAFYPKK